MGPNTPTPSPLQIYIDGKSYTTHDHDQEAAALLRLADRDPMAYDLFLVKKDGVEERIKDDQIVDLKDGEHFVSRQKIHFAIDGESYETYDNTQTAAALLRLAGVDPDGYDLARILPSGGTEKFRGDEIVALQNGDDFVTAKHVGGVA